jgi:hypothetical protein
LTFFAVDNASTKRCNSVIYTRWISMNTFFTQVGPGVDGLKDIDVIVVVSGIWCWDAI